MATKEQVFSAKTESLVYHSDDMLKIAIVTFGWKTKAGKFWLALVTFIDVNSGDSKKHTVRPYISHVDAMKSAEQFAKTGEIIE